MRCRGGRDGQVESPLKRCGVEVLWTVVGRLGSSGAGCLWATCWRRSTRPVAWVAPRCRVGVQDVVGVECGSRWPPPGPTTGQGAACTTLPVPVLWLVRAAPRKHQSPAACCPLPGLVALCCFTHRAVHASTCPCRASPRAWATGWLTSASIRPGSTPSSPLPP